MSELKWTTDLPTEAGWYWVRDSLNGLNVFYVGHFYSSGLYIEYSDSGKIIGLDSSIFLEEHPHARFCGPLKPPEEEE